MNEPTPMTSKEKVGMVVFLGCWMGSMLAMCGLVNLIEKKDKQR